MNMVFYPFTLGAERLKLADNIAETLAAELLNDLQN